MNLFYTIVSSYKKIKSTEIHGIRHFHEFTAFASNAKNHEIPGSRDFYWPQFISCSFYNKTSWQEASSALAVRMRETFGNTDFGGSIKSLGNVYNHGEWNETCREMCEFEQKKIVWC